MGVSRRFGHLDLIPVPHPQLFEHIKQYGPELRIGLGIASAKKMLDFEAITFTNPPLCLNLYKHFRKQGNKVIFLESAAYYQHVAERAKALKQLRASIERTHNEDARLEKLIEQDKLEIEIEYLLTTGKEPMVLERIAKEKPDIAFLQLAHAARFYRSQAMLKERYGIAISEYWEDEVVRSPSQDDILLAAQMCDEYLSMEHILKNMTEVRLKRIESAEQAHDSIESMPIERSYKAVKESRITDGKPDFIGTWDTGRPHRGLFEMFVQERVEEGPRTRVRGVIEDCNGNATFEGEFRGERVAFTKVYTKAMDRAAKGNIFYEGWRHNTGEYQGEYSGMDCGCGLFTMKKFEPPVASAIAQPAHPVP